MCIPKVQLKWNYASKACPSQSGDERGGREERLGRGRAKRCAVQRSDRTHTESSQSVLGARPVKSAHAQVS